MLDNMQLKVCIIDDGGLKMENDIQCCLQLDVKLIRYFDSEFFSADVKKIRGLHRLLIHGAEEKYESILATVSSNIPWIIFSSDNIEGYTSYKVPFFERLLIDEDILHDSKSLYYLITNDLTDVLKINEIGAWSMGNGIGVPLRQRDDDEIRRALYYQINLLSSQKKIIEDFGCFLLAHKDGYGVNVIWSDAWEYAGETMEWAIKLAKKYPCRYDEFIPGSEL